MVSTWSRFGLWSSSLEINKFLQSQQRTLPNIDPNISLELEISDEMSELTRICACVLALPGTHLGKLPNKYHYYTMDFRRDHISDEQRRGHL